MKVKKFIDNKSLEGSIKLTVEREDDIFHCYNLIGVGDLVTCTTTRNVVHESKTGSTEKSRTKVIFIYNALVR